MYLYYSFRSVFPSLEAMDPFGSLKILQAVREIIESIFLEWQRAYLLYISTSVWVLQTPNTGQNMRFEHFLCLKAYFFGSYRHLCVHLHECTLPF